MEIIHITYQSSSGGALFVSTLTRALTKNNIIVNLVCPTDFQYRKNLQSEKIKIFGIGVIANATSFKIYGIIKKHIGYFYNSIIFCNNLRNNTNIVHLNHIGEIYILNLLLIIFLKMKNFRIIYTVHDIIPHKWFLPNYLSFIEKFALNSIYGLSDCNVVHYEDGVKFLNKSFGIDVNKIKYIPHFGPSEYLRKTIPRNTLKKHVLTGLMFGGIRETKGIHLAVKAIQELNKEGYKINLIIAGHLIGNEKTYWEMCKKIISEDTSNIEIVERYIEDDEVGILINRCDFFLLPYSNFYSQSGVASIAIANARPIVGTDIGGISDFVKNKRIGIKINGPDPSLNDVINALRKAYALGSKGLKEMGGFGQSYCRKRFSLKKISNDYNKLYNSLV